MALAPIPSVIGTGLSIPGADIDTDEIIPARFLKCVTFGGLGEAAFYDSRYHEDGSPKDHPMNDERFAGAAILVTGINFGCGSSREHAPQALYRFGFRAVIAESFAEIFFSNSTNLGMPCVTATGENLKILRAAINANPALVINLDLETLQARFGEQVISVAIPESSRGALVHGRYDQLAELLEDQDGVHATAAKLAYFGKA